MPVPVPGSGPSLLRRIIENLESVWTLPRSATSTPIPTNAPIHILDASPSANFTSHAGSTGLHVLICVALLFAMKPSPDSDQGPRTRILSADGGTHSVLPLSRTRLAKLLGRSGNSGGPDLQPPTAGNLLPSSRFVVAHPILADSRPHPLTVRQAIYAPDAPEMVAVVESPGLPWMKDANNSPGHGKDGIGDGNQHGMGKEFGDGVGVGKDAGPYSVVTTQVSCQSCPDPLYSDEARRSKLQGRVTLRVLVGADGRAKDIRVIQGLGSGLDENSIAAVRYWQFFPAKDAAGHPVAVWITIETVFRLF